VAQAVGLPPLRWAVVIVGLDPVEGHEQAGERRALVVSYEAFHRSGLLTVCPISAARETPRYPDEVAITTGEAGQTKPGLILCAQVRTISARRIRATGILPGGGVAYLTDPRIRSAVRAALRHQLGLDIPPLSDGAGPGSDRTTGL
jgi:mRNA-degrading endonuclease toxin of MazEF toxin-antitoxin module